MTPYATFFLYLIAATGLMGLVLGLNAMLGPRVKANPTKLEPFECGATPIQQRNVRPLPIKYYPIAILFLLFDLDTVLLFIWAVSTDRPEIATLSLLSFLTFMGLLGLAFVYLWRDGGLEWR